MSFDAVVLFPSLCYFLINTVTAEDACRSKEMFKNHYMDGQILPSGELLSSAGNYLTGFKTLDCLQVLQWETSAVFHCLLSWLSGSEYFLKKGKNLITIIITEIEM